MERNQEPNENPVPFGQPQRDFNGAGSVIIGHFEDISKIAEISNVILDEKFQRSRDAWEKVRNQTVIQRAKDLVPRKGKIQPEVAKEFIDGILTKEEQELIQKSPIRRLYALKIDLGSNIQNELDEYSSFLDLKIRSQKKLIRSSLKELGDLEDTEIGLNRWFPNSLYEYCTKSNTEKKGYGVLIGIQPLSALSIIHDFTKNDITVFGGDRENGESVDHNAIRRTLLEAALDIQALMNGAEKTVLDFGKAFCFVLDILGDWDFKRDGDAVVFTKKIKTTETYEERKEETSITHSSDKGPKTEAKKKIP